MEHSLFYSPEYSQVIALYDTRLGAVAFTVLWCEVIYQYVVYPMHCCARLGEQYNCESIQVTISGDHIEVPVGVPSVSTQCLGLLRVLEPSRRGTPLRLPPC